MKTYHRITLDSKPYAELVTSIDLNLKTIKFVVINKTLEPFLEKSFDNLEMAHLSYCFIKPNEP